MVGVLVKIGRAAWPAVRGVLVAIGAGSVLGDVIDPPDGADDGALHRSRRAVALLGLLAVLTGVALTIYIWRRLDSGKSRGRRRG